jgi:tetratricopeptide (TPR) repeat protein
MLDAHWQLLDRFRRTIVGLRTGQSGLAFASLSELLDLLEKRIVRSGAASANALPVIQAMFTCKEQGDMIGLADLIQFELPAALSDATLPSSLLDPALVAEFASMREALDSGEDSTAIVDIARSLQQRYVKVGGLTDYPAFLLLQKGFADEAEQLLTDTVRHGSATPITHFLKALALGHAGEWDRAADEMRSAYAQSPILADGFTSIAVICMRKGDWGHALTLAQLDSDQKRQTPAGMLVLAQTKLHTNSLESAEALVAHAYAQGPELRDGFATLAWESAARPSFIEGAKTLSLIDKDVQLDRLSPQGMLLSSKYYVRARRFEDAERMIQKAYDLDPTAIGGFGRAAAAALTIGEERRGLTYWQRDRMMSRETKASATRFDFMQRPAWKPGDESVYIYNIFKDTHFAEILQYLEILRLQLGSRVFIEAPSEIAHAVSDTCPDWQIIQGTMFGDLMPPEDIPPEITRLSIRDALSLAKRHAARQQRSSEMANTANGGGAAWKQSDAND